MYSYGSAWPVYLWAVGCSCWIYAMWWAGSPEAHWGTPRSKAISEFQYFTFESAKSWGATSGLAGRARTNRPREPTYLRMPARPSEPASVCTFYLSRSCNWRGARYHTQQFGHSNFLRRSTWGIFPPFCSKCALVARLPMVRQCPFQNVGVHRSERTACVHITEKATLSDQHGPTASSCSGLMQVQYLHLPWWCQLVPAGGPTTMRINRWYSTSNLAGTYLWTSRCDAPPWFVCNRDGGWTLESKTSVFAACNCDRMFRIEIPYCVAKRFQKKDDISNKTQGQWKYYVAAAKAITCQNHNFFLRIEPPNWTVAIATRCRTKGGSTYILVAFRRGWEEECYCSCHPALLLHEWITPTSNFSRSRGENTETRSSKIFDHVRQTTMHSSLPHHKPWTNFNSQSTLEFFARNVVQK